MVYNPKMIPEKQIGVYGRPLAVGSVKARLCRVASSLVNLLKERLKSVFTEHSESILNVSSS